MIICAKVYQFTVNECFLLFALHQTGPTGTVHVHELGLIIAWMHVGHCYYLQVSLQVLIIATGNYNFFNLLTVVLCLSLVDDRFLGYG